MTTQINMFQLIDQLDDDDAYIANAVRLSGKWLLDPLTPCEITQIEKIDMTKRDQGFPWNLAPALTHRGMRCGIIFTDERDNYGMYVWNGHFYHDGRKYPHQSAVLTLNKLSFVQIEETTRLLP